MTDTANLGLPCIEGSQAQKHVTHNEALRMLDTLVQLAVNDRNLTVPPSSPVEGQRYIVKTGASGAWAGHADEIAAWQDGAWQFSTPRAGWLVYVIDETLLLAWNGTAWIDVLATIAALNNLALLGIGTTADVANPLSAKLNNALFTAKTVAEGGDGDLRYKMNKESAARTASLLFQSGYSGRAEVGLTGDDNFRFKVSADGAVWREGIVIDRATGAVTFPNTTIIAGREVLGANRTYYVRSDGNDGNNGLANNSGGAFATIQKAIDVAASLDTGIFTVTIQVGAGTWTAGGALKSYAGTGPIIIVGDETTPSNVTIAVTTGNIFTGVNVRGIWEIRGLKFSSSTSGAAMSLVNMVLRFRNCDFGTASGGSPHIIARQYSLVTANGSYTISGSASAHLDLQQGTMFSYGGGVTVTLSGTPAFATAFLSSKQLSLAYAVGVTFSGAATGPRYVLTTNSVAETNGAGATYLPGNAAGSLATGAQYN